MKFGQQCEFRHYECAAITQYRRGEFTLDSTTLDISDASWARTEPLPSYYISAVGGCYSRSSPVPDSQYHENDHRGSSENRVPAPPLHMPAPRRRVS